MKYPEIILVENEDNENLVKILENSTIEVDPNGALCTPSGKNLVQSRCGGNFRYSSFWLNEDYDWVIGKDEEGLTILVPLKNGV